MHDDTAPSTDSNGMNSYEKRQDGDDSVIKGNSTPIQQAIEWHIEDITGEVTEESAYARRSQLRQFRDWCDDMGVATVEEVTPTHLFEYKQHRSQQVENVTLRTSLSHLRSLLHFCADLELVDESLPSRISIPTLDASENVRDTFLDTDTAQTILEHYSTYQYASLDHTLFLCAWQFGARVGALHSLDIGDIDVDNKRVHVVNRPDEETRLKNGNDGERVIAVPADTIEVLVDYIQVNRLDVTDDYGREPLFTTEHGRMSTDAMSRRLYYVTTPCHHGQDCPDGRDPLECDHARAYQSAIECPYNVRPHDIRRGAITHWLREDVPQKAVSDRMDVSERTLDRHYDKRTESEKAEQRRSFLNEVE